MAGVDFTREDVVEQAGVDPWETADDFAEEIDVEEMAEASRGFAAAAGEAGSASEVAARASEVSQEAATTDGIGHHNAEEHITITDRDLQGSGQDIEDVADIINSATELAADTEEQVSILRSDAQEKFHEHLTDARSTYQNKFAELVESAEQSAFYETPSVTVAGTVYKADGSRFTEWLFPQAALDAIREHYLGKAAEDITSLHGDMETEIEDYRSWMVSRAGELTDLGYDIGAGPHSMWGTEGMAEYSAEGIEEEMAKPEGERNLDRLEDYTAGLAAIGAGVYDPDDPTTPRRDLTPEEREYLDTFYDTIDADTLAALGHLSPNAPAGQDVGAAHENAIDNQWDQIHGIQAALGNGINMLTNPEIGGIDLDAHPSIQGPADIPESIRAFVYDADQDLRDAESLADARGVMSDFNGFGAVMEQATVPPGDTFAHHLTTAALDVQQAAHSINVGAYTDAAIEADGDPPQDIVMPDFLENTGSSGLLSNVALNTDASFEILSNEGVRDELFGAQWADSDGVGDLVRSAVLPNGGEDDSERRALADTVIQHFTNDPSMLIEDWNEANHLMREHYPWDTSGLQGAVSDATLSRLDAIAGLEGAEGIWETDDRYAAFSLMAATDESVYEHFKSGVFDAQRNMAYEYYANGDPQDSDALNTLQSVGSLTGLMEWGERDVINWYEGREDAQQAQQQKVIKSSIGAALSVAGTLAPTQYATGVNLGSTAYGLVDPVLFPDYKPQEPGAQADYSLDGHEINMLMEQRALTAGAIDAHNEQVPPEAQLDVMSPEEAMASWNGAGTPHTGLNESADGITYRSDSHVSVAEAVPDVRSYGSDDSLDYDKTRESLSSSSRFGN
ncbi:hypothetical protein FH609_009575 [Streptomyces sp. 3MP-14]|uniref:TPR repeat domain-containing protein n=1 Tax=Streptomyces mimosae TaxID=2586635 RepID=A0A5N6AJ33_9ACTN|nr:MULTISPECIES: hypothetical protein [Streptomyces]KAB8167880.1 hypothetical protein FH607_007845 [Streptomyces mimosae]KAB8177472.1 hypothetical protein FH609_009575 [Streptomyces sp. 3MP-14]